MAIACSLYTAAAATVTIVQVGMDGHDEASTRRCSYTNLKEIAERIARILFIVSTAE